MVCNPSSCGRARHRLYPRKRLGDLRPLWRALYEHHAALTPHLRYRAVPFERAWETRRGIEKDWLKSEPESFVIAAQDGDRYLGYAFVRVCSGAGFAASWSTSDPIAELATLAVLPESQGKGIGSAIMDAVDARLRKLGIEDMTIEAISTNTDAIRFYERRGAVPFLTRLIHRVQPDSPRSRVEEEEREVGYRDASLAGDRERR
jgi:ribosomal protein S18 acetylase RimI-like enzyme